MNRAWIVIGLVAGAAACSSSAPKDSSDDGWYDDDAATPKDAAAADASTDTAAPCTIPGAAACDGMLGALCARMADCCGAAGAPACAPWALDATMCKAHWVENGYDCAAAPYSSKNVCSSQTTACQVDIPLVACSDMYGGTANWPSSCQTFWKQF